VWVRRNLVFLYVIICFFLVLVVLVQQEGADIASAGGG
jgi:preprotein translocase subunit SecG